MAVCVRDEESLICILCAIGVYECLKCTFSTTETVRPKLLWDQLESCFHERLLFDIKTNQAHDYGHHVVRSESNPGLLHSTTVYI